MRRISALCISAWAVGGCAGQSANRGAVAQAPTSPPPAVAYTVSSPGAASCPFAIQQNPPVVEGAPAPIASERQPVAGHEAMAPNRPMTVRQGTANSLTATCAPGSKQEAFDASCCTARVHFASNSAAIEDAARPMLSRTAKCLLSNKASVTITGHADDRGTVEYNQALGQRRAQAVADFLSSRGVPQSQMQVASDGEDRPLCTNHSDVYCQADNRRTDILPQGNAPTGPMGGE